MLFLIFCIKKVKDYTIALVWKLFSFKMFDFEIRNNNSHQREIARNWELGSFNQWKLQYLGRLGKTTNREWTEQRSNLWNAVKNLENEEKGYDLDANRNDKAQTWENWFVHAKPRNQKVDHHVKRWPWQ